jgi:Tfp pilus assembly protein PilF
MKIWPVLLLSMLLAACATPGVAPLDDRLFNDRFFAVPSERIDARDVFAMSAEMKHFLATDMVEPLRTKGTQKGMIDALYNKDLLKLAYDSSTTRNAAETFEARSGNCLSLVIMTGAFAKQLGLTVRFQTVYVDETVSRSGDLYFYIGHVNLTVGRRQSDLRLGASDTDLTIDFLPQNELRGLRARVISEETIIAMYMNNRAAESLARGHIDDAYWWAREAIREDPRFLSSYNTLGVIYRRHGNLREAEAALAYAIEREPANVQVMSNLVPVLKDLGRVAESKALAAKLASIEPDPPFSYYDRGLVALRAGDYRTARDLFLKEIARAAYYHEFHFWLAVAYMNLGEAELARKHLVIAMETSATRNDHDLYAAKLDRLQSSRIR